MKEKTDSYEVAFQKLAAIVKEMESENINIDMLANKVQEAEKLIKICKEKLKVTENEVSEIIRQLDQPSN